MSIVGASPRRHQSPLQRRKRGAAAAARPAGNQACVEVQWRFLPPSGAARPVGKPGRVVAARSPVDFYNYGTEPTEGGSPAVAAPTPRQATEASRVLDGLTGETQRQAALDRILAEMHGLMLQPHASAPHSDGSAASPAHDRRKRSSVLLDSLKFSDGPVGSGVSLLPQRKRSALGVIADSRGRVAADADAEDEDEDEADGNRAEAQTGGAATPPRQKWKCHDAGAEWEPQFVWEQTATARPAADLPHRVGPSARGAIKAAGSPRSPAAASPARPPYGAWYIPQRHWWPLRQLEQQAATDAPAPALAPAPAPVLAPAAHAHCHRGASPAQRQHKPPVPPASPLSSQSGRRASACAPTLTPPAAVAPSSALAGAATSELQLADSYIGREYRSYIVATGSPLPNYLK